MIKIFYKIANGNSGFDNLRLLCWFSCNSVIRYDGYGVMSLDPSSHISNTAQSHLMGNSTPGLENLRRMRENPVYVKSCPQMYVTGEKIRREREREREKLHVVCDERWLLGRRNVTSSVIGQKGVNPRVEAVGKSRVSTRRNSSRRFRKCASATIHRRLNHNHALVTHTHRICPSQSNEKRPNRLSSVNILTHEGTRY